MSAAAALVAAVALAGCGTTTYFAGRTLPPSGIKNRVLIAMQNPNSSNRGALVFVDAYYDTRYAYNNINKTFSISGFGGALPTSIQNMPEEELGAVYGSGDGSLTLVNYAKESTNGTQSGLNGLLYSSIFITKNQSFVFGASTKTGALMVVDQTNVGGSYQLGLPGAYRVSVNPGGSVALAFTQDTNYVYYPRKLTAAQTIAYSGGQSTWPKAAVDCEPRTAPGWCLFEAQSPDSVDSTGNYYGAPLVFDHPTKAVFSADGGTAYILSCGPECGGARASVSLLPVAPMIFQIGQSSGQLPTNTALSTSCATAGVTNSCNIDLSSGGANNALVASSTLYVVGQHKMSDGLWGGYLTVVNLATNTVVPSTSTSPNPVSISDGAPGTASRMQLADDNTLWIGMIRCTGGERYNNPSSYPGGYGCLTMYNTSTNTVTLLEPYIGDLTGIAAVTGLHKIYVAQNGQVYIYSTTDGTSIDNQYVTVTVTAWDVAYMDADLDSDNTVY
jgi:hypothetical protein